MLGKLIKYESKAVFRTLAPIYIAILLFSVILQPGINLSNDGFLGGILGLFFGSLIIAMSVLSAIAIIQRFHRAMFSNEGYLMHTLPVKTWQHIAARLVVAVLIVISGMIVVTSSFAIMLLTSDVMQFLPELMSTMLEYMRYFINFDTVTVLLLIESIYSTIVGVVVSVLTVYLAISIGNLWSGKQVIGSVFAFIGISVVGSNANDLLMSFVGDVRFQHTYRSIIAFDSAYHVATLFELALQTVFAVLLFVATNYILKNKLNLE